MNTLELLKLTKKSAKSIFCMSTEQKNALILSMAKCIEDECDAIIAANDKDIELAKATISEVMLDRLRLNKDRVFAMASGMREIAALPDPVGEDISQVVRPNGLVIKKRRVPLGLVSIIYESRPNVTSDAACLAIKSGNSCVLRCGKEAHNSASAIVNALKKGIRLCGCDDNILNLVTEPGRESARVIMNARGIVDLLIPRGGAGLIAACVEGATVPCIQTGTGICHIFVDETAQTDMALSIVNNAKTSRPSVCNAAEVLLIHEKKAPEFLPKLKKLLVDDRIATKKNAVELKLCDKAASYIDGTPAGQNDFDTEFLDYILAVKVVSDIDQAVEHISTHSSGHSEAIITQTEENAKKFVAMIDSSAVYVNASTRFTDGGEFGLGCEMGISTQKLHARGPMGLCELTTYKYVIEGNGQIR